MLVDAWATNLSGPRASNRFSHFLAWDEVKLHAERIMRDRVSCSTAEGRGTLRRQARKVRSHAPCTVQIREEISKEKKMFKLQSPTRTNPIGELEAGRRTKEKTERIFWSLGNWQSLVKL